MAKAFTLEDVGNMDLDDRKLRGVQRVEQGDRGVGKGAGVDDDAGIAVARRLDAVDQHALVVALREFDREPQPLGFGPACLLDVGQGLAAVDLRLTLAQHVEIGPVEHQHRLLQPADAGRPLRPNLASPS